MTNGNFRVDFSKARRAVYQTWANKWLKENVVGRAIEIRTTITEVSLTTSFPPGLYDVDLEVREWDFSLSGRLLPWGGEMKLGNEQIRPGVQSQNCICMGPFDVNLAKKLRELKGQTVAISATIRSASFEVAHSFPPNNCSLLLILYVDRPTEVGNIVLPLPK